MHVFLVLFQGFQCHHRRMTVADDNDDQSMELIMMPTRRTTAKTTATETTMEEEELFEDGFEGEEEEYQDADEEEEEEDESNLDHMFLVLQNEDDYYVRGGGDGFNLMGDSDDDDDDDNNSLVQEYFAALSSTSNRNNNNNNSASHRKTIRFAENVRFIDEEYHDDDKDDDMSLDIGASMKDSLNLFGTSSDRSNRLTGGGGVIGGTASEAAAAAMMTNKDGNSTDSESDMSEEEDEDGAVVDKEKEQEKQIVKTLLYAGFGFGLVTLAGMGAKKIMSVFSKSSDQSTPSPTDAVDAAQQAAMNGQMTPPPLDQGMNELALQGAQQLTTDAAANASMTASQGNMSSMAGGFYAPPPGMQGAQYVELVWNLSLGRVCANVPCLSFFVWTETLPLTLRLFDFL
jgi:hypothetical protein